MHAHWHKLILVAACTGAALVALDQHASAVDGPEGALGEGTYRVGTEISAGLYRYQGYYARLGRNRSTIANGNATSGWGLFRVWDSDDFVETSDIVVPAGSLPSVDPVGERYRDGTYLVGDDLAVGEYELIAPGARVFYQLLDRDLTRIDNHLANSRAVLAVDSSVFAVEIKGLLVPCVSPG